MGEIKINISDELLNELLPNQEKLEEVLKLGLKKFNAIRKKKKKILLMRHLVPFL